MPGRRARRTEKDLDHADLVTHSSQSVPRAEQVVYPDQGVPLVI
jgi:hypothetical protein